MSAITRTLAEGAKLGTVELAWNEDPTAADLVDAIADVITDVSVVKADWADFGIGPYEYGSECGVDVRLGIELNEGYAVLCIPHIPTDLPLPEVGTTAHGGGCDGEHHGRCRVSCQPWSIELVWTPTHHEIRDGQVYVVYVAGEDR